MFQRQTAKHTELRCLTLINKSYQYLRRNPIPVRRFADVSFAITFEIMG